MITYSVSGRSAAPSASGDPYAVLWNASTAKTIYVVRISVNTIGTADPNIALQRTSTRGTPGSTITPVIDNDYAGAVGPVSAAVLDLADFTALPTFQGPRFAKANLQDSGGGHEYRFDRFAVPQSTGLMIEVVSGLSDVAVTFEWLE